MYARRGVVVLGGTSGLEAGQIALDPEAPNGPVQRVGFETRSGRPDRLAQGPGAHFVPLGMNLSLWRDYRPDTLPAALAVLEPEYFEDTETGGGQRPSAAAVAIQVKSAEIAQTLRRALTAAGQAIIADPSVSIASSQPALYVVGSAAGATANTMKLHLARYVATEPGLEAYLFIIGPGLGNSSSEHAVERLNAQALLHGLQAIFTRNPGLSSRLHVYYTDGIPEWRPAALQLMASEIRERVQGENVLDYLSTDRNDTARVALAHSSPDGTPEPTRFLRYISGFSIEVAATEFERLCAAEMLAVALTSVFGSGQAGGPSRSTPLNQAGLDEVVAREVQKIAFDQSDPVSTARQALKQAGGDVQVALAEIGLAAGARAHAQTPIIIARAIAKARESVAGLHYVERETQVRARSAHLREMADAARAHAQRKSADARAVEDHDLPYAEVTRGADDPTVPNMKARLIACRVLASVGDTLSYVLDVAANEVELVADQAAAEARLMADAARAAADDRAAARLAYEVGRGPRPCGYRIPVDFERYGPMAPLDPAWEAQPMWERLQQATASATRQLLQMPVGELTASGFDALGQKARSFFVMPRVPDIRVLLGGALGQVVGQAIAAVTTPPDALDAGRLEAYGGVDCVLQCAAPKALHDALRQVGLGGARLLVSNDNAIRFTSVRLGVPLRCLRDAESFATTYRAIRSKEGAAYHCEPWFESDLIAAADACTAFDERLKWRRPAPSGSGGQDARRSVGEHGGNGSGSRVGNAADGCPASVRTG